MSQPQQQQQHDPSSKLRMALVDVVGGTVGGILQCLVGHPLDTLKVRLQTQPVHAPIYSGLGDVFRKTVAQDGLLGLYKGVASPLAGQAAFNAVQFLAYGRTTSFIAGRELAPGERLTVPQYFAAGAFTGSIVALVESPQDLFKSQLQVQVFKEKPQFSSVWGCVRHIVSEHGVRGVYQGLGATVLRNVPAVSCYFGFYELARNTFAAHEGVQVSNLSAAATLAAGGIGGIMYWAPIYPLDVIKSAIQGDAPERAQRRFKGVPDAFRQLRAEGGLSRFYRGFAPCMLRAVPANAICFFGYEQVKSFLEEKK